MYVYAFLGGDLKIVEYFQVSDYPVNEEELEYCVLVDAVHEDWIGRKRWVAETQTWVDVLPTESTMARNSLEFTHIDADGTKHWLDDFVNDLAEDVANAGGVDTSAFAPINHTHSYLPLSGGTITGDVNINGKSTHDDLLVFTNSDKGIQAKHPTNNNLYHQFQPINSHGNCTLGYGLYNAGIGSTDVFGQKIDLKSKSGINLMGDVNITSSQAGLTDSPYGINQVLWNGVSYMESGKTAPLSKKVSEMPHGIVLVFSAYTVGTGAQTSHWHYFFVPKYVVGVDNGGGSSFTLSKGGKLYSKYIYINDTELTGSADNNNSSYSFHGQTVDNRNFVLRYVIGV